jgi:hypothetical protein
MIQVLPEIKSFGQEFAGAVGKGAGEGFSAAMESKKKMEEQDKENEAIFRETGIDLSGIIDDKKRQEAFKIELEGRQKKKKSLADIDLENESYADIKSAFGKRFADIWKASPTGGKTELLKAGIDAKVRGSDIQDLLEGTEGSEGIEEPKEEEKTPQMQKGQISKDYKWPDYNKRPQGYSPKEWIDERKTWRKDNSPVFLENKTKLQNNKRDAIGIKNLNRISDKLPEGMERYIINPETGEPYGLAQLAEKVPPEVQEWVKETARFQNRAKDAFGSRVTNFDLVSYMKQFPGLLNTKEGRKRILKMMSVNNQLDQLYENALQKVYQKYGLNGIPLEEADNLAQKFIEEETDKLSNEYLQVDEENAMSTPRALSGKKVDVIGPDGQPWDIDESELDQLPKGYRIK